ncbi:MAG: class I SAM-dependent methyltransferase [Solirubrobacteraceae bacterium]
MLRDGILAALPSGWALDGKRVLDFGCGAGRTLRHFLSDADKADFWGCDIYEPSIAWIQQHLSPPLRVFSNAPAPPLEVADGSFDLVYASRCSPIWPTRGPSGWLSCIVCSRSMACCSSPSSGKARSPR